MIGQVRAAKPQDSERIWQLILELARFENLFEFATGDASQLRRWLFEEPVATALVVEEGVEIVGYAIYFVSLSTFRMKPSAFLEDLFVLQSHRGRGYGKALIQAVFADARARGYARVDWTVLDWNTDAIEFYRSLGAELLTDWRICRYVL